MTLQQLKYVIVIADSGSVNSAAKNRNAYRPFVEIIIKIPPILSYHTTG